jgi:hypothetical protein
VRFCCRGGFFSGENIVKNSKVLSFFACKNVTLLILWIRCFTGTLSIAAVTCWRLQWSERHNSTHLKSCLLQPIEFSPNNIFSAQHEWVISYFKIPYTKKNLKKGGVISYFKIPYTKKN